jgi:hypothetical protein
MIQSISIVQGLKTKIIDFDTNKINKTTIECSDFISDRLNSFTIKIEFSVSILSFRNFDYSWVDLKCDRIATEFSSKIIKLSNQRFVQANISIGVWEVEKRNPNVLLWKFNPENSKVLTNYEGEKNRKVLSSTFQKSLFKATPSLLFTDKPLEFSRSKIPFSAIAIFTDHCDFDTLESLQIQRAFFKEKGIRITKGFFLNNFSKRKDNASYEDNAEELLKWRNDGHELCYHSLSQSIKSEEQSFEDFLSFQPPFQDTKIWIDHGYQPYNLSLYKKNEIEDSVYENNLTKKNISILWNYIDSGTATKGVLNQLNVNHFTLSKFLKGNKDLSFIKLLQLMIKNTIFHFINNEETILQYKNSAGIFKKFIKQKKLSYFFTFIKNSMKITYSLFLIFLFWNKNKRTPYKLSKYNPIVFKHTINKKDFYIFQTIEMIDFKKSLCKENIDNFVNEKGVFIAHTYFSVPMDYHQGKMFLNATTIDATVALNFEYLGEKIKNNQIWNPELQELVDYWNKIEEIELDIDSSGNVFFKNENDLIYRIVN